MEKRILSVCLTACMLLTLMPSAFAADVEQPLPIAGMEQTEETSADARTEPGDEPQEPVPTEEGKGTQEEPFTTVAAYNEAVKGDALDGNSVALTLSSSRMRRVVWVRFRIAEFSAAWGAICSTISGSPDSVKAFSMSWLRATIS